jgi:hypothetical protein
MQKLFLAILFISLVGCGSVLVTYEPPQSPNLIKLKLPKNDDLLYKLGELDEKGCASNMRTVRDASYLDSENVYVQTDKGVVLHVNGTGKTRCSGNKAMNLEAGKEYEAFVLTFPYVCGIFINDITDGKKGEKVETKDFRKGCVKD